MGQEGMIRAFSTSGHISQVKFDFLFFLQLCVNREMDQISGELCHSPIMKKLHDFKSTIPLSLNISTNKICVK